MIKNIKIQYKFFYRKLTLPSELFESSKDFKAYIVNFLEIDSIDGIKKPEWKH